MISDLRSALATANEKIITLETSRAVELPPAALSCPGLETQADSECAVCKERVENKEMSNAPSETVVESLPVFPSIEFKNAMDAWGTLCHDKREVQHKIAVLDQLLKDFEYKITIKNQKNDRVENISLSTLRYMLFFSFILNLKFLN